MPYSLNWYIEHEVIYVHYSGAITVDELRESLLLTKHFMENSSRQLIHVLTDVGDVTRPLSPKDSLTVIREVGTHSRAGWQIVLRERSILIKVGVAFGTSIFKSRTRTFETLEEAETFLMGMDPSLSWDKADKSILPMI